MTEQNYVLAIRYLYHIVFLIWMTFNRVGIVCTYSVKWVGDRT